MVLINFVYACIYIPMGLDSDTKTQKRINWDLDMRIDINVSGPSQSHRSYL